MDQSNYNFALIFFYWINPFGLIGGSVQKNQPQMNADGRRRVFICVHPRSSAAKNYCNAPIKQLLPDDTFPVLPWDALTVSFTGPMGP